VLRPARMVRLLAGKGTAPLVTPRFPFVGSRPPLGRLKGLPRQGDYFLPGARIREPFSIAADPIGAMTLFEHDTGKLKGLAETLRSADIALQLGRSPGAPVVKAHQLKSSLKRPEDSRRDHSHPDPRPSGSVWPHD
jgi:hypothetical protein